MPDGTHEQAPNILPQAKLDNFSKYLADQPPEDSEADIGFDADDDGHADRAGHVQEAAGVDDETLNQAVSTHGKLRCRCDYDQ